MIQKTIKLFIFKTRNYSKLFKQFLITLVVMLNLYKKLINLKGCSLSICNANQTENIRFENLGFNDNKKKFNNLETNIVEGDNDQINIKN